MSASNNDKFGRYRAGSARFLFLHSVECEEYYESNENLDHPPTPECTPVGVVTLPHQCDAWSIGTVENLEAMIADLQAILAVMKGN